MRVALIVLALIAMAESARAFMLIGGHGAAPVAPTCSVSFVASGHVSLIVKSSVSFVTKAGC